MDLPRKPDLDCPALETSFGTFILSDRLADYPFDRWPDPIPRHLDSSWVSWAHIYPMSLLQVAAIAGDLRKVCFIKNGVNSLQPGQSKAKRIAALERYAFFYRNWQFQLGEDIEYHVRTIGNKAHELNDRRVIGFHLFQSRQSILRYAKCWELNEDLRDHFLSTHYLVLSRLMDLVCSELLANGFDHCGSGVDPKVFIVANICSPQSISTALDLDRGAKYLTTTEQHLYRAAAEAFAQKQNGEILQICIGNVGQGFAANAELKRRYLDTHPTVSAKDLTTAKIIQFAVEGKVSTKTATDISTGMASDTSGFVPDIHGLSEVARMLRGIGATWRIHSNDVYVELDSNTPVTDLAKTAKNGTPIQGCLHYINIPLFRKAAKSKGSRPVTSNRESPRTPPSKREIEIISLPQIHVAATNSSAWMSSLLEEILAAASKAHTHDTVVLIEVQPMNDWDDKILQDLSALLVRQLYVFREKAVYILSGVNARLHSLLGRFAIHRQRYGAEWIILEVSNDVPSSSARLSFVGSEVTYNFRSFVEAVLNGSAAILDEIPDSMRPPLNLQERFVAFNPRVFKQIVRSGVELELARAFQIDQQLESKLKAGGLIYSAHKLLDTLNDHHAIAIASKEVQFLRLFKSVDSYIHFGRIWADPQFRNHARAWASFYYKKFVAAHPNDEIVCVAILHPAIEVLHEMLRALDAEMAGGPDNIIKPPGIVEIQRTHDIRWDFAPLKRIAGRSIVVITDVRQSGATLAELRNAARILHCKILGSLTLLAIGNPLEPYKIPSSETEIHFCYWDDIFHARARNSATRQKLDKGIRIVDVDSQFTQFITDRELSNIRIAYKPDPELNEMLKMGRLRFGHWDANNRHSSFIIYLREWYRGENTWTQEAKDLVIAHVKNEWENLYGVDSVPDLVVYPGNSTAVYLVEAVAQGFICGGSCPEVLMAVPCHREYGSVQLRFESSASQRQLIKRAKKILFFDDSLSTGTTEQLCIEALFEHTNDSNIDSESLQQSNVEWLTFVMVGRGFSGRDKVSQKATWLNDSGSIRVEIQRCAHTHIGPHSVSPSHCMLCGAEDRLRRTLDWAIGARPATQFLLARLRELSIVRGIEERTRRDLQLPTAACGLLLHLSSLNVAHAAMYIHVHVKKLTADERLGVLLFVGLNQADLRAFVAGQYVVSVFLEALQVLWDERSSVDRSLVQDAVREEVFLWALSLLPISTLEQVVTQIIGLSSKLPIEVVTELPSAAIAILIASLHYETRTVTMWDADDREGLLSETMSNCALRLHSAVPDEVSHDLRRLLVADIGRLCRTPSSTSAAWLAQTLSCLLSDGRHPFFLQAKMQLLKEGVADYEAAKSDLLHVVELSKKLIQALALQQLSAPLKELKGEIVRAKESDEVLNCFTRYYDGIWTVICKEHILSARMARRIVDDCLQEMYKKGRLGVRNGAAALLCRDSTLGCQFLSPRHEMLVEHIKNVLDNPVTHCGQEFAFDDPIEHPFLVVWISENELKRSFDIVVIDKGTAADREYFFKKSGLYNAKLQLHLTEGHLSHSQYSEYARRQEFEAFALNQGISGAFNNVFITSLPLMPLVPSQNTINLLH